MDLESKRLVVINIPEKPASGFFPIRDCGYPSRWFYFP
jgi:hypothetical protein